MTDALFPATTAKLMSDLHHSCNYNSIHVTTLLVSKRMLTKEAGLTPRPSHSSRKRSSQFLRNYGLQYNEKNVKCHENAGNPVLVASVFDRAVCYKCITLSNVQVRRSRVRFPMVSLEFFIDIILLAALWPLGSTQPLTEMSTGNISWG